MHLKLEATRSLRVYHATTGEMQKSFTLLHTVAAATVFSAVSGWYGFMFGRESARKELNELIENLKNSNPDAAPKPPHA